MSATTNSQYTLTTHRSSRKDRATESIPHDWHSSQLQELVRRDSPICYGIVQPGPNVVGGVPVLAIRNLTEGESASIHRSSREVEAAYRRSRVRAGDVLVSVKGTTGRVGLVPDGFEGNISRDLARLRFTDEHEPVFWYQMLTSSSAQRSLLMATVGTTRQELSIGILKEVEFAYPSKPDQRAIATALGDLDRLIDALKKLIAKKQAVRHGMMQELLTGKSRLPGSTAPWSQFRVAEVVAARFSGPSPTCEERNIRGREWGVLKTTCSTWENGWDPTKHKVLPESFWGNRRLEVQVGDTIITKAGPRHRVGVPAYVSSINPHIIPSGKMICLRPDQRKVVPGFLALALADHRTQAYIDQRTTGMAESQVNFENRDLLGAPLWLPELSVQRRLLEPLEAMHKEITTLRSRGDKTKAIKQGMMQELLTGRTRLPVAEAVA
jgi:type I restriction enzyme, S subunit